MEEGGGRDGAVAFCFEGVEEAGRAEAGVVLWAEDLGAGGAEGAGGGHGGRYRGSVVGMMVMALLYKSVPSHE